MTYVHKMCSINTLNIEIGYSFSHRVDLALRGVAWACTATTMAHNSLTQNPCQQQSFENFLDLFEVEHDDVCMRDFSQSLQGNAK